MTYPCGSGRACATDWTLRQASPYESYAWKAEAPGKYFISHRKIWESVPRVRAKAGLCSPYSTTNRPPKLVCLCNQCWGDQGLAPAPAQTVGETIYFNTGSNEYAGPDRELVVKSIACHEWHHYMSCNHRGFQDCSTSEAVDWDEVVTDYLGREVYSLLFGGDEYKTFYNEAFQNFRTLLANHIKTELERFQRTGGPDYATYKAQNPELVREIIDYLDDCGVEVSEPRTGTGPGEGSGGPPPSPPDFSTVRAQDNVRKPLKVKVNQRDLGGMMVQSYFTGPAAFEAFRTYLFTNAGFFLTMPQTLYTKA